MKNHLLYQELGKSQLEKTSQFDETRVTQIHKKINYRPIRHKYRSKNIQQNYSTSKPEIYKKDYTG